MSLQNKFTELGIKLTNLATRIKQLSIMPRDNSQTADNSLKLEGRNLSETVNYVTAAAKDHESSIGDPHTTNADQVGIFTKTEFDNRLKTMIPAGILPISNFGLQNYLPLGVTGSFEGASTDPAFKGYAMVVEEDGTLVVLRNGTNGSRRGVFYCYINEAETGPLTAPVRTGKQYRPAHLPDGTRLTAITTSSESVFVARLENEVDGTFYGWLLTLTNGTMDDKLHEGMVIVGDPAFGNGWASPRTTNLILGERIYFFTFMGGSGLGSEFAVYVRTCLVSDIRNGTLTQLTGIDQITTESYSGTITSNKITIASKSSSRDLGDRPLVLIEGPVVTVNVQHGDNIGIAAYADDSGLIRIAVNCRYYYSASATSAGGTVIMSVVYDPSNNSAVVDHGGINDQAVVSVDSVGKKFTITGDLFKGNINNVAGNTNGNSYLDNKILTKKGTWFNFISGGTVDVASIRRTSVATFVSRFDTLERRMTVNHTSVPSVTDTPLFPTPLGSLIGGPICISADRIFLHSYGRRTSNGALGNALVDVILEGGPTDWIYRSANGNPDRIGYSPARHRVDLRDHGIDPYKWVNPVVEIKGGEVRVSGWHFSAVGGLSMTREQRLNADLTVSGTPLTVPEAILTATARRIAGEVADTVGAWTTAYGILIIPEFVDVPPYMWIAIHNPTTRYNYCVLVKVLDLTISNRTVTHIATDVPNVPVVFGTNALSFAPGSSAARLSTGAWNHYDTEDAVLIGGPIGYIYSTVGNGTWTYVRFKWKKSTNEFVQSSIRIGSYNTMPSLDYSYFAHPDLGFCQSVSTGATGDNFTKCLVMPYAKTEAEFDAWKQPPESERIVLGSQDVSEGWTIYFTDPTPVFMMGTPFIIDITAINLKDIDSNPANKTFYVYVQLIDGRPQYTVTLTELPETFTTMFIGKVKTNQTQIESIDVDKVYRIDTMRMSTSAIGSAIPTTSGHPADVVKLNWT